ncbi:MAG: hypothetical protein ACE5DN_05595, partial [Flavobacteriales bacterium]
MDVQYVGEHLLAGRLGNALVILAFFSALLATFSFYLASGKSSLHGRWKRLGRSAFYLHSFSVAAIIALLLWMLIQ